MEGILYVPPDRGTIIGRALWKARYIVIGSPRGTGQTYVTAGAAAAGQPAVNRTLTPRTPSGLTNAIFLSIYKNKDDLEPIQQHAIGSLTDCQVQMLSHRKQGPILPTLVISISPDPLTDKLRKRRSSRTAGFTSSKETGPTTLWFRTGDDTHHSHKHILQDWSRAIQAFMLQHSGTPYNMNISTALAGPTSVLSPITPATPTFTNPFASSASQKGRDLSEPSLPQQQQPHSHRPGSDHNARMTGLHRKASNQTSQTYSSRDRPTTCSESPSLRSRRSDLSHSSSTIPSHVSSNYIGGNNNSSNSFALPMFQHRPTELPSPATTVAEFQNEPPEGWAITPSRSSTVSSPVRGRGSVSSQPPPSVATMPVLPTSSSSPPAPRETILDRAFQMRIIPGSGSSIPGEEKLSSLARFEALMRDVDDRRRLRQTVTDSDVRAPDVRAPETKPISRLVELIPKSAWDDDDSDEDSDSDAADAITGQEDDIENSDNDSSRDGWSNSKGGPTQLRPHNQHGQLEQAVQMAPKALRALDFIANRHTEGQGSDGLSSPTSPVSPPSRAFDSQGSFRRPMSRTGTASYDVQALSTLNSGYHPSAQQQLPRPQTGYARNRPAIAQRTHSQPQLAPLKVGSHLAHLARLSPTSPVSPASPALASPEMAEFLPLPTADDFRAKLAVGATSLASPLHRSATTTAAMSSALPPAPSAGLNSKTMTLSEKPSTSSMKRLSFNEFTKRISTSTTNLLMLQTNASVTGLSADLDAVRGGGVTFSPEKSGSGHGPGPRRSASRVGTSSQQSMSDRCSWRGGVGVLSSEGGFL